MAELIVLENVLIHGQDVGKHLFEVFGVFGNARLGLGSYKSTK